MQKTKIEWVINPDGTPGYTWNPIVGCLHNCFYCYGKRIAKRFGDDYMPKYHPDRYLEAEKLKKPSTIFVGSMGDMFGDWIDKYVIGELLDKLWNFRKCPIRHTYIFLTKNPRAYSSYFFYENMWIGITLDYLLDKENLLRIDTFMSYIHKYKVKSFVSLEPLLSLEWNYDYLLDSLFKKVDWIIIGALTENGSPKYTIHFQEAIEERFKPYQNKIFVKDSVYKMFPNTKRLRALPYLEGKKVG